MEKKQITEGNRIIAEFMGMIKDNDDFPDFYQFNAFHPENWIRCKPEDMRFHTHWDWLMPVIEKICRLKIGDGVETVESACLRTFGQINEYGQWLVRLNGFSLHEARSLIEATFLAVVEFIEWYNQQVKEEG